MHLIVLRFVSSLTRLFALVLLVRIPRVTRCAACRIAATADSPGRHAAFAADAVAATNRGSTQDARIPSDQAAVQPLECMGHAYLDG